MRTPTAHGTHRPHSEATVVTMASRLELRRVRDVPVFLLAALRLRRRFQSVDGGVSLDLDARPRRRTFFTLSTWRDQGALDAFTADPLHREVMRTFRPRMAGSAFVTWAHPAAEPASDWTAAMARLDAAADPPRVD